MAYAGKKNAAEGEGHELQYFNSTTGAEDSMWVTDDWWNAFNEYSINPSTYSAFVPGSYLKDHGASASSNSDVLDWYNAHTDDGGNPLCALNWHDDWVFGFHHFNQGIRANQYWWGEGTGAQYPNLDFMGGMDQWNHIGVKKHADIKDSRWDADADKAYFSGDYFSDLGTSLDGVSSMLAGKFGEDQSYYETVMNITDGKASYAGLSDLETMEWLGSMVESRDRVWQAATEIFGPVNFTWNDQQMMQYFNQWLNRNRSTPMSHAINFFRFLLGVQHSFINQVTMFYETGGGQGYTMSALDNYAFRKFSVDMGSEWYTGNDIDGDGNITQGKIVSYVKGAIGWNGDIENFLRGNLSSFSFAAQPGDIGLPSSLNGLSADQKTKLKAVKWMLEQWFGATKVQPGYNSIPKWEGYDPDLQWDDPSDYTVMGIPGVGNVRISKTITDPNGVGASYSWDRVFGPFSNGGTAYFLDDGTEVNDYSQIRAINTYLKGQGYSVGYMSPYTSANHPGYVRTQFGGLSYDAIEGHGEAGVVHNNSWAVYVEGQLYLAGYQTDMMRMWNWLSMNAMMKKEYDKDQDNYDEAKERIEWETTEQEKVQGKKQAELIKWQKETTAKTEGKRKQEQADAKNAADRGAKQRNEFSKMVARKAQQSKSKKA